MVGVHGEHLITLCSASWISGYGRGGEHLIIVHVFCQLDFWLWYRGGEHLIIVCSASWISGYGRDHCQLDFWLWQGCQLDFWLWYRGGEHLIIVCSASWILAMHGIGVVSILLLCVLPAGFWLW